MTDSPDDRPAGAPYYEKRTAPPGVKVYHPHRPEGETLPPGQNAKPL